MSDDVDIDAVPRPPRPVTQPHHEEVSRKIDIVPGVPGSIALEKTTKTYSNGEVEVWYFAELTSSDWYTQGSLKEVKSELHQLAVDLARTCIILRKENS